MEPPPPACVLVVEDEPAIRMFLVDALEDEGYQVLAAANGVQALDLLAAEQRRPSVIVLDMQMPAMDGVAFAEAYRQSPEPHAPIVVVTAYRTQGQRAAALGADEVLLKPVDLEQLLAQVARHVHPPAARPSSLLSATLLGLLLIGGLLGLAAATPVLAQSHSASAHVAVAVDRVETSSITVDAHGIPVSLPTR